jgi:hypothetical protein
MTYIDTHAMGDSLNRMVKLALDSGEAANFEAALALFSTYALHLDVGAGITASPSWQAALLTAANASRRTFLGGVTVSGGVNVPCCLPGARGMELGALLQEQGVRCTPARSGVPIIHIGGGEPMEGALLRTVTRGWSGGCVPASQDCPDDPTAFVLAGVVAGALAVCEVFQRVRGNNPAAGRRSVGLSLWQPGSHWLDEGAAGILPTLLPAAAWIIGLGNLGQAYLWSLGLLPYARLADVSLTLQDFDRIAPSNDSTSLLTSLTQVGKLKTREMAAWAESRGFRTRLIERAFASDFRISDEDPCVALCGTDNGLARAALEDAGFACVIEAGLGSGVSDFLAIRLHGFPQQRRARDIWSGAGAEERNLLDQPAYRDLAARGGDQCGLVQLAGRTVGAPFVGAVAGALVVAELVRLANGGGMTAVADLHLRNPDLRTVIPQPSDYGCNPGITQAELITRP